MSARSEARLLRFTYDLARSIVYTRQGNPAWVGQERDDIPPLRSDDLFFGDAANDPQPDWVDLNKVAIPQADEQQRLLVNLIQFLNADRNLLPRFWYFPDGRKAVVVMTGDDHANNATNDLWNQYADLSEPGSSPEDWGAIRGSSYIYTNLAAMSDAEAAAYTDAGFELGLHVNTGCSSYTSAEFDNFIAQQLQPWIDRYPSIPIPTTHRIHCIAWSGYAMPAEVQALYGIRLDVSYYYYPDFWVADRPGMFTGSGMPMRFAEADGTIVDSYQAATQMTDESGQSYPFTMDVLFNRALGSEGYYGAFVANMHTDFFPHPGSDAIINSALDRNVPVISARQLLTWVDARNRSAITNIQNTNGTQTFSVDARALAKGLEVMVPVPNDQAVTGATRNGNPITPAMRTVKGVQYAVFPALTGNYAVSLSQDVTGPSVVSVQPSPGEVGVGRNTQVLVTFSESMNTASINAGTIVLRGSNGIAVNSAVSWNAGTLTATVDPTDLLLSGETYTVTVVGGQGGVLDASGNPMGSDHIWAFTTAASLPFSIWSDSVVPGLVDGGADSPVALGIKFRSDVAGTITGIRFYKSAANVGTHVGSLWASDGTLLATATFTNETASGWQQVNLATPVAISASTVYVASYHCNNGHYSADVGYFSGSGFDNAPLHALQSGVSGANGVYGYGPDTTFPTQSWMDANYWVDVVFE